MYAFFQLIAVAWVFAAALMVVVWALNFRISNLGIVDIAWSYAFAPVVLFFAIYASGFALRRELIGAMVGLWSLRLGTHVAIRVFRMHPKEDPRYAEFREKWRRNLKLKIFFFFQIQALSVVALAVPFLIVCLNAEPHFAIWEWAGLALWMVSFTGESLADHQLNKFKANPANKREVCQAGLWRYSRHPNYFFEALTWVAYWMFALGSPLGCATIYCPALMLYFLLRVTGIPLTERQSLKSKGEKFRTYQRTTSMFVPWFPKRTGNN